MTLVLTELSPAGIAMAADSAITKLSPEGRIVEVDEQGWTKLLTVPSITAGVSYWGMIGAVTRVQFDVWLRRVIQINAYTDLSSFAEHLVSALNDAAGQQPLADKQDVGIHVAGYGQWPDGQTRPVFYHVHNGHGEYIVHQEYDSQGRVIAIRPEWVSQPRKLFQKHQDFPKANLSAQENLSLLEKGYTTRNGEFFVYAVLWSQLSSALDYIHLIPGVSFPRDPSDLNSRKGFLHTILEIMVRLYRCSNQSRIIGGDVTSLGIGRKAFLP